MRAVKWKELVKLCKGEGCAFDRQKGDHYIMTKPGSDRPRRNTPPDVGGSRPP